MQEPPDPLNIAYCAGRDVAPRPMADEALIPFDLWQNRAHVVMLSRQNIIPRKTAVRILGSLADFGARCQAGKIRLDPAKEDVHINIEHFVAANVGQAIAGTMHTARSRNDQSATVVRMYVRQRLLQFGSSLGKLVQAIIRAAGRHAADPVAGFTHYQPASVTTVGHWFASYSQALLRDLDRLLATYDRLNVSPLGAAASFGTSWNIDRALTARLLGFAGLQENSLDCITNRWEMEADATSAVAFALTHLSIVAQDLILLSSPQHGILRVADRYTTGSSIMPQKRNPDFAEVTRAKAAVIHNLSASLFGIARGLLSGYNRDTQWTKYLAMDALDEAAGAPEVFSGVFETIRVDRTRARQSATDNFVNAVDIADNLARKGNLPFRTCYEIVSTAVKNSEALGKIDRTELDRLIADAGFTSGIGDISDPAQIAEAKGHAGGPAKAAVRASLQSQGATLRQLMSQLRRREKALDAARHKLAEEEKRLNSAS